MDMGQMNNNSTCTTELSGRVTSHEDNRRYWLSYEGLTSEAYFWQRLVALFNDSWEAQQAGDVERMQVNMERISWVEPMVRTEPYTSMYETGLVMATLPLAYVAAGAFQLGKAYDIAQRCRSLLISKRNRRREMGLSYRPDSEAWYRLYSVLAEMKWKGSSDMRNSVTTPENLVCDYLKIERRCLQFLDGSPGITSVQSRAILFNLGCCGLNVIKMAMRWCPQHVKVLIEDFNETHGQVLAREPGHFVDSKPIDPRNPWYWDFELYKWCTLGPATRDEATLCYQWRTDSLRSSGQLVNLNAFSSGAARELEFLLDPRLAPQPARS